MWTFSGKLLYRIPFEVKKSMATDDIAQLAQYAGSLACQGEFVRQNTSLAFLIDENYIGFSPFSLGDLPLPICIFTPPICWRNGTRLEQGPCVALCLLQRLVIKRTAVTENELAAGFTPSDILAEAKDMSSELGPDDEDGILQEYVQEVKQLRMEV